MTETDPVSEMPCFFNIGTMEKVQKPSDSEHYTLLSEPFGIKKASIRSSENVAQFKYLGTRVRKKIFFRRKLRGD
jgi:hypothetical protein